ncbi:MAG: FGGY-family carbohydrate kinase [Synergistaceae bacterium]|jgi:xylulokinase|nr:FGGY-family carbohydrate kinase [Synergistaceae bacterium]
MPLFAGADIGTTTLKAGIFDDAGCLLRERSIPHPASRKYGWDGVDPVALFRSLAALLRDVIGPDGGAVEGISFSSFGETVFPVNRDAPLHHGIHWYEKCTRPQFDRVLLRTTMRRIREVTKLDVSWTYSAAKMLKFKEDFPEEYGKTLAFLDASSYLAFMLTGDIAFDLSLASRTQLLDLTRGEWSAEMAELWEIDIEKLPPLTMSTKPRGTLRAKTASELGVRKGTTVTVAGHDHIAGALGSGVSRFDQGLISVGTSAAFFSPMPPEAFDTKDYLSRDTMSGGYSAWPGGMNALTGMNAGGFCVDWFIHKVMSRDYGVLDEFARGFVKTDALFLPNLRAQVAKLPPGGFTCISDSDTGLSLLQSIMEAIAFECRNTFKDIFRAKRMEDGMKEVTMMGGGALNAPFVKILANTLNAPIKVHRYPHSAGLLGCAMASAIASGFFKTHEQASAMLGQGTEYHPDNAELSDYLREKFTRHMAAFRGGE